jgi:hypothetical protein
MKVKIDVDEAVEIIRQYRELNKPDLTDIEFTRYDKPVPVDPEAIAKFSYLGLNNTDFIRSHFMGEDFFVAWREATRSWINSTSVDNVIPPVAQEPGIHHVNNPDHSKYRVMVDLTVESVPFIKGDLLGVSHTKHLFRNNKATGYLLADTTIDFLKTSHSVKQEKGM